MPFSTGDLTNFLKLQYCDLWWKFDFVRRGSKSQVRQLLDRNADGKVIATCRDPSNASNLSSLKEQYGDRLTVLPLDVTKESTIKVSSKFLYFLQVFHLNVSQRSLCTIDPSELAKIRRIAFWRF